MRVLPKGPRAPVASAISLDDKKQQQDKNESKTKKKSSASASAGASTSKETVSSAAKKNKTRKSSRTNSNAEEEDQRPEQQEDQSSNDQSSKRSAGRGQEEKEKKKKKKKERIPLIDRVPTAMEYDSDDSLERMVRQKSRYSRYMTEYDVNADNFVDDDADGDNGDGEDEGAMDKYNAIARLWSSSTDSDPPQWRSWDGDGEIPAVQTAAPKETHKLLVANDEDEISAMFHSKPTSGRFTDELKKSGRFTDELKKVVSNESNRHRNRQGSNNDALNLNNNNMLSKTSKEYSFKWEHIESTEGGQVETVLDPLKALGLADIGDDDDDDDDIEQIIRPSSSDTSSLTDPIMREEMLIAARIRASANENENLKPPDVPRVLSLTKKRSHETKPSTSVPALTMLTSNDSTNEPRTGVSKSTASASSPSLIQANGPTAENTTAAPPKTAAPPGEERGGGGGGQAVADVVPEKSDSLIEGNVAAKISAIEDKMIPKVNTVLTLTSKAPINKQNRPVRRRASANSKASGATIATEVSDVAAPKTGDAALDEASTKSRKSFFSRVPFFRSLSGLRGISKSKSRDGKSRTGTPTPKRVDSDESNEKSADKRKDTTVQKPSSRRTVDKYTPTEEKEKIVSIEAPIPQGDGDEKVLSSSDAKVSSDDDNKVSSDDDKKENETKAPSNNDGEMKESPPPCDKAIVPSNDNPDDSEQTPPQENNGPQDMNALLAATDHDKQEPAWCDTGKRGLTSAERNLMYSKSLVNDSGSESSTLDRATGEKKAKGANLVNKARKVKKAQMMELDEYSYAISVDEEPDMVQCLKFYYCGAVAAVFGVAIAATDCNNPKKQIKGTEVRTGVLSRIEEVDEVEAQRWRDDTLSPKVEVILEDIQKTPRPFDHVDIDLAKGKRQQHNRKKKTFEGEAQSAEKDDEGKVKGEQKNTEEEGSDGDTPELEIEHQISRVKEVTKMHFSLEEDSEENRRHEAMLRARRMAAQPQRQEIPITSIQIPSKSTESNEEQDPNPAVEERGEDGKKEIGGENGDDTTPKPDDSGSENDHDEKEVHKVKKIDDDETMETGSSQESPGSRSKRSRSAPPQKKKRLFRFLPRLGRKATKDEEF